jgi:hypothetical protein
LKSDFLQFGLRVLGTTIDGIMFGGSAYSTGQLQKGDVIIKMNGNVFSADELSNLLQDGERAGDKLVLGVCKSDGYQFDVELSKTSLPAVAAHCKIADLLQACKVFTIRN